MMQTNFDLNKKYTKECDNFVLEDSFHLGVKTIIKNSEGQILILEVKKGAKHYWDLPGGRVQKGEQPEITALREVMEETGINTLQNLCHKGMIKSCVRIPVNSESTVGLIFSFYTAYVENTDVILSVEHHSYQWVTQEKALELLTVTYGESFAVLVD